MKNVLILAFALIGLECAAQKQPLFISKGDHNPSEVKSFALGNSSKAVQYKNYLLVKTGETSIEKLFEKVSVERRTLGAGSYQNSCWNVQTDRIEFYSGKEYTGDVTVYVDDSRKIILYKNNCGNLLNVREEVITLSDEDLPYVEEKVKVVTKEVVVEKVIVEKQVVVMDNTNYNPRPRVNLSWGMSWNTPRPMPYHGGNTNVVNNNIYNNNNNNNNNYNNYNPRPTPRPTNPVDTGGPGGAGLNTNTGGPGGTGMNTNTGNNGNNNGYGGPGGTNTNNQGGPGGTGMNTNTGRTNGNYGSGGAGYNNNGYGGNQKSASYSQQRQSSGGYANNQQQRSSSNGYGSNRR